MRFVKYYLRNLKLAIGVFLLLFLILLLIVLIIVYSDDLQSILYVMIPAITGVVAGIFRIDTMDRKDLYNKGYSVDKDGNVIRTHKGNENENITSNNRPRSR